MKNISIFNGIFETENGLRAEKTSGGFYRIFKLKDHAWFFETQLRAKSYQAAIKEYMSRDCDLDFDRDF
jgi:hypothetical protein